MRLRQFLTLMFFAFALIPVAVYGAWLVSVQPEPDIQAAQDRQTSQAKDLATTLDRDHRNIRNTFGVSAWTPGIWAASDTMPHALIAKEPTLSILFLGLFIAFLAALATAHFVSKSIEKIYTAARHIVERTPINMAAQKTHALLPKELWDLHRSMRILRVRVQKDRSKLERLTHTDPLTKMANRNSFRNRFIAQLEISGPQNTGFLMMIDLDGFRVINETKGHDTADAVLKHVAKLITHQLKSAPGMNDPRNAPIDSQQDFDAPYASRLGGDEFALILPNASNDEVNELGKSILDAISTPFNSGAEKLRIGACIGIAQFPSHGCVYSDVLRSAEQALRDAKRNGRNQVRHYTPDLKAEHEASTRLVAELAEGFTHGQFEIHFQPVYDAQSFKITNVETFLRWKHPKLGLLEAADFLESAKHFGFQEKVDMFIFEQTQAMVNDMTMRGALVPAVSINFWMDSFANQDFVDQIVANISQFPCPVTFELIKSNAPSRQQAIWGLDRVREAGVRIALDDFGAVSKSISGLIELQPTSIKIDGTLTRLTDDDPHRARLLASIVDIAHSQSISVGAKGIETLGQVETLRALGCDYVQGRALNGPMPYEDLLTCLNRTSTKPSPKGSVSPTI